MSDRRRLGLHAVSQGNDFDDLHSILMTNDALNIEPANREVEQPSSPPPSAMQHATHSTQQVRVQVQGQGQGVEGERRKVRQGHVLLASEMLQLEAALLLLEQELDTAPVTVDNASLAPLQPANDDSHDPFSRLSRQKNPHTHGSHSRSRRARSPGPAYYQPEIWTGPPVSRSQNKYGSSGRVSSSMEFAASAAVDGSPRTQESARVRLENARLQTRLMSTTAATDCLMDTELAALRRGEMARESRARKAREAAALAVSNQEIHGRLRKIRDSTGESPALRLHRMQTRHVGGRTRSPFGEPGSPAMPRHLGSGAARIEKADPEATFSSRGDEWLQCNPDAKQRLQALAAQHAPMPL